MKIYRKSLNLCDPTTVLNGYYNSTYPYSFVSDEKYRAFTVNLPPGTYRITCTMDNLLIKILRASSVSIGTGYISADTTDTFTHDTTENVFITLRNENTTEDFTGLKIMLSSGEENREFEPYNVVDWYNLGYHIYSNNAWSASTTEHKYTNGAWN